MFNFEKSKFEPQLPKENLIKRNTKPLNIGKGLCYMYAPSGYGKTSMAAIWAKENKAKWVNLDETDAAYKNFHAVLDYIKKSNTDNSNCLVLDNFHPSIHIPAIDYVTEGNIGFSEVVIISRNPPPEKLFGLIAKRLAHVIDYTDISFSKPEIKELYEMYGKKLSSFSVDTIYEYTGGWAALLMSEMALSDINGCTPSKMWLDYCSAKYFISQIYDLWKSKNRQILLKSAIIDYIDPAFINALTGDNGFNILLQLYENTGFLIPCDGGTYKYHPIFRSFLLNEPEWDNTIVKRNLYMLAAKILYGNKNYIQALQMAVKAEDSNIIEAVLTEMCTYKELNCGVDEICRLAELLRKGVNRRAIEERPIIKLICQWSSYILEKPPVSFSPIYNDFPENIFQKSNLPFPSVFITLGLPFFHRAAINFCEVTPSISKYFKDTNNTSVPFSQNIIFIYNQLLTAGLLYEKNQPNEAYKELLQINAEAASVEIIFCISMLKAEILLLQNKDKLAIKELNYIESVISSKKSNHLLKNLAAFKIKAGIYRHDINSAFEWLDNYDDMNYRPGLHMIFQDLVTARSLIVADRIENAMELLERLLDFSKAHGRIADQAEILTLQAACLWHYDKKGAVLSIEEAIAVAGKAGLIMPIASEGADILHILEHCINRMRLGICTEGTDKGFLMQIYICSAIVSKNSAGIFYNLKKKPVKLSKKQLQILKLLSESLTYEQIAEETGVKITTVRDHISRLYEKLDVGNSRDALIKGREMKLI